MENSFRRKDISACIPIVLSWLKIAKESHLFTKSIWSIKTFSYPLTCNKVSACDKSSQPTVASSCLTIPLGGKSMPTDWWGSIGDHIFFKVFSASLPEGSSGYSGQWSRFLLDAERRWAFVLVRPLLDTRWKIEGSLIRLFNGTVDESSLCLETPWDSRPPLATEHGYVQSFSQLQTVNGRLTGAAFCEPSVTLTVTTLWDPSMSSNFNTGCMFLLSR